MYVKPPAHCVHIVPRVTARFSAYACFGREKEASELAPEASADLSDFLARL